MSERNKRPPPPLPPDDPLDDFGSPSSMRACPVTGTVDHRVTWRCYALVPACWLSEWLPYRLSRPFTQLVGWLDDPRNPPKH